MATATETIGHVVQIAGPAVDCQFPEGEIPEVHTAIRITSEGYDVPEPIDIICECEQHIGEGRIRTIAMQPTEGLVRGMKAISLGGSPPLMASELFAVPGASDGARTYDPNNAYYYREGRSQSACEALEHCLKL